MKIGILGSGNIGGTVGSFWAKAGHEVMFSSRNPASLADLVAEAGPTARAGSVVEAVTFGDVILIALPWRQRHTLPDANLFAGKIVIDAMNAYGGSGLEDFGTSTSSEEVAKLVPGARLVKAFNTMYFKTLETAGRTDPRERIALFVAGDDADAKQVVTDLIEQIGFAAVDTGGLHDGGRRQQPGSPIYNVPMAAERARAMLGSMR